jgi:hypothetical protein
MARRDHMIKVTIGDERGYAVLSTHYSTIDRCLDMSDARVVKELCTYLTPTVREAEMRVNGIDYIVEVV